MSEAESQSDIIDLAEKSFPQGGDEANSEPATAPLKTKTMESELDGGSTKGDFDEGSRSRQEKGRRMREDMDELKRTSPFAYYFTYPGTMTQVVVTEKGHWVTSALKVLLVIGWFAYLIAACIMNWNPYGVASLVCTIIVLVFITWEQIQKRHPEWIQAVVNPMVNFVNNHYAICKWSFVIVILALVIIWIALDTVKDTARVIAMCGGIIFIVFTIFTSAAPARIKWRPVFWGLGLAFFLAIFVLRTAPGNWFFEFLSDQVSIFLGFAQAGAEFVFGGYANVFAFSVLPVVTYFAAVVACLYYIGFMEYIIKKMGWLMSVTMKTTGPESMVAAGNIFLGQTESPLMVKPFLSQLTDAEILSIMTSGFASIAGSVLGAFILMGVPSVHLITACVISAPVSLAVAKMTLPEMGTPIAFSSLNMADQDDPPTNIVHAIAKGTSDSIPLVANIAAMLIAFISILEFLDAVVGWLGEGISIEGLTITQVLGYFFYPVVFLMGIPNYDCGLAGELVGVRVFVNEFAAFGELSILKETRENGELYGLDKFVDGKAIWLDARSEDILTYSLAGFANFGSCGMMIGSLGGMCPEKSPSVVRWVLRALFAANMACFIRGSIAGMMM